MAVFDDGGSVSHFCVVKITAAQSECPYINQPMPISEISMSSSFNPYPPCVTENDFMSALHEQQQIWQIENHPSGMRLQWLRDYFVAYEAMQRDAVGNPLLMRPCDTTEFVNIIGQVRGMQDNYSNEVTPLVLLHAFIYPAGGFTKLMYTEEQLPELARAVLYRLDRMNINPAFVTPIVDRHPTVVDRQLTESLDALLGGVSGGQIVKAFADGLDTYESPDGMLARREMTNLNRAMRNSMEVDDSDLQAAILASLGSGVPVEDSMDTLD